MLREDPGRSVWNEHHFSSGCVHFNVSVRCSSRLVE